MYYIEEPSLKVSFSCHVSNEIYFLTNLGTFHARFLHEISNAIVKRPDANLLISLFILKVPQPKDPCFVANV